MKKFLAHLLEDLQSYRSVLLITNGKENKSGNSSVNVRVGTRYWYVCTVLTMVIQNPVDACGKN